MFPWEREAFPHRTGKAGGMTDLRDGGWATPSEELTALALEARRRGATRWNGGGDSGSMTACI